MDKTEHKSDSVVQLPKVKLNLVLVAKYGAQDILARSISSAEKSA